ncbi:uncharacterized protein [Epargyreus clarus]|uniref:uncharacterized protein isoform X3 n=1 Tax=Epargyreus clarus TaxID=520877 RepID=UPI003C2DA3F6
MRAGVWWSAAALTLLIVVTSALRTPQVDGTSRTSRRLSSSDSRGASSTSKAEEVQPTFRPRNHRRREEPTTARKEESPRDVPRTRSRTRPPEKDITPSPSEQLQTYTSRNERFDSRRTSSRSRSRAVENDVNIETSTVRDNNSRGRTRQSSRRATLPSTPTPIEVSSPQVEEKAEIINNNFEDISKTVPKEENTPINTANQFRRRSSTSRTIVETVTPKKNRGRVNTRGNLRSSDLEVSGTTNTLSALLGKEPTTARSGDLRSSRKLRYRTRPSDTDSNLTGEGLATLNEVIGSSQKKERLTSQSDTVSSSSATVENVVQQITEKIPPKTTKGSKVVRRPLVRGKTQTSSSPSETLSVRASQKVFKTYPQSSQSIHSDPDTDKQSLLRSKPNLEEENEKITVKQENVTETTVAPPKNKSAEYRPRGTYTPRNRKASSFTSSSTSAPLLNTEKPYKFSRKFNKISTTTTPRSENSLKNKRADTTSTVKKPLARSSYYSRKFTVAPNLSTQAPAATNNDTSQNTSVVTPKTRGTLPRTAFYSRLRNKVSKKEITSSVEPSKNLNAEVIAEKKSENTAEMPIILTMFSGTSKDVNLQEDNKNKGNDPFIISVTSTESQENSKDNEVVNRIDETEKKPVINVVSTTQKYHAHYNDKNSENISEQKEKVITGATPPIRNIQTRKYGRKPAKAKDHEEIVFTTPKSREKSLRKYSDTFSKTTEPSTNVITPEPEKPKNRFSSKYRASYLDKPFYKPTVPTVTPSTVEGEEMQLGPDMNAISFTQTGSTLSSADLRLSESLVKPLQVMNVEASHHSPSVTVSIFDALAEILTSTPRPRISTTTEVMQTQNSNNDVKQTLNGVSNNINVNSVNGLPSQDTLSTISINTNTKSVQTTDQTTPNVFNSMSVGESVTPSLNIEEGKTTFVNTPIPFTLPPTTPTTPLSARRPFAIKVLYSDTESPTDKITTASVPLPTQPPTDRPTTVYNTVSDLLLSANNKIVSSELTSMLSNNIKNIIQNMDEDSRSRISVDMAKLLKSLIPRALDKLSTDLDNSDSILNTTPYSLEDIYDTANIEINSNSVNNLQSENLLQSVTNINTVNTTEANSNVPVVIVSPSEITPAVNSPNLGSTTSLSDSQTTSAGITMTSESLTQVPMLMATSSINEISETAASSRLSDTDSTTISTLTNPDQSSIATTSTTNNLNSPTNKPALVPFLTNFQPEDFTSNGSQNQNLPLSLSTLSSDNFEDIDNIQYPSQPSPLQLWVLSKKARVLKMIEDLLRQHNNEIANAPLTEIVDQPNIQFSSRLTEIMNTMNLTTESPDLSTTTVATVPMTTSTLPSSVLSSTTTISSEGTTSENPQTTTIIADIIPSTITQSSSDVALSTTLSDTDRSALQATSEIADAFPSTTPVVTTEATTVGDLFRSQDISETTVSNRSDEPTSTPMATEMVEANTSENIETTTTSVDVDDTDASITTESDLQSTTQAGIDTSTVTLINETKSTDVITVNTQINVATQPSIPKKDYVIFGILPNNTVVRKDPNDNVLESLTEASPYIIYGVLPNNTVIRKFPNGTRVPRIMQKIDVLPISPWSLRNPYSPIHNIPAIVRPRSNPIRVSTNTVTSTDTTNNGTENQLTTDIVNNLQMMISSSALNIKDSSLMGITTATNRPPAEKSTASHVLSLRTTTMLPSVDEILLNSISSATKEEMVISSMTSSTREPRILTLDIDPETKQIRTEKPSDGSGNTVFKFIPIDEVTVTSQESNVLKLASTKMPQTSTTNEAQTTVTESNTQSPQIQTRLETFNDPTTTTQANAATPFESNTENANTQPTITMLMNDVSTTTDTFTLTTESVASTTTTRVTTLAPTTETTTTTQAPITTTTVPTTTTPAPTTPVATTVPPTTTTVATTTTTSTTTAQTTTTTMPPTTTVQTTIPVIATSTLTMSTTSEVPTTAFLTTTFVPSTTNGANNYQKDAELLQSLLQDVGRNPKNLNLQNSGNQVGQVSDDMKFLQALLSGTGQKVNVLKVPNSGQTTTLRSIEDDIRQFEEDTKLLKALLQATGRNPAELNLPSLDNIKAATTVTITNPTTTTTTPRPTTTTPATTPATTRTTTPSINDDIRKLQEDAKLLQSLLQATGQNPQSFNLPVISGITSNVRISSNPLSTSVESNPTSPLNIRPVYTTLPSPVFTTSTPRTATIATTFQSQPTSTTTEVFGISTTFPPINANIISTTPRNTISPQNIGRTRFTTEIPSTSTFSVEEDLVFLQNLKSVLNTNTKAEDPEAALANRIIALAVERSLNEIQTGAVSSTTTRPTTTVTTTTTMRPTTTRQTTTRPTTTPPTQSTRSIEDDIKQFEEDTKLLQALLKATGQDPSKFNIPTLPTTNRPSTSPSVDRQTASTIAAPTTVKPFGAKIAVKDDLRNVQDDAKLLQTLKQLQDAQDITTQKNKLALTGQSSDEALQKLIQQANPTGMVSEATKSSISLSTEYGNSNDALLAALLKEQGFGPTTASSLDEQLRLSALLNQVVVTPKARRTTTPPPPPPPPAPRRPILDGLAWLWQQWRDTAPGSGEPRPNRRPTSSARPSPSPSPTTSSRVNWFGSGPFVGNADDRPASNRIPLEPPRAVAAEQAPGRGQLVSAAINVTRAFSQFLGAAIQGAAQTVQNVIRAGQRAATDVYSGGSGASG